VVDQGFSVLAVHDLGHTLCSKGLPFPEQCRIFEVYKPQQAAAVLNTTMALNMALPCRISVYTDAGQTRLGMIRPEGMLAGLSADLSLREVARGGGLHHVDHQGRCGQAGKLCKGEPTGHVRAGTPVPHR
jgi:uncharacterized protein (DUF302 family)